jgi:hypothetical protein
VAPDKETTSRRMQMPTAPVGLRRFYSRRNGIGLAPSRSGYRRRRMLVVLTKGDSVICDSPEAWEIGPERTEGYAPPHARFQARKLSAWRLRALGSQALTALFGESASAVERCENNREVANDRSKGRAVTRSVGAVYNGSLSTSSAAGCALPSVRNAMKITAGLKNLPSAALTGPAGPAPRRSDSLFVHVKRSLVVPHAAAELGALLGYLVEVVLELLIFCTQGLGGVIKILGHGEPFSLVSRAVRLLSSKTQGLNSLVISLASSVPDLDLKPEIAVNTGTSGFHISLGPCPACVIPACMVKIFSTSSPALSLPFGWPTGQANFAIS